MEVEPFGWKRGEVRHVFDDRDTGGEERAMDGARRVAYYAARARLTAIHVMACI